MHTPKEYLLLTGGTGFFGRILCESFSKSFQVATLGRGAGNDMEIDIRRPFSLDGQLFSYVVHNAGKAHIYPRTEEEASDFFKVNLEGTRHLLDALETVPIRKFVFISSVAVFGQEICCDLSDRSTPDPQTPYGKSKLAAEDLVRRFCEARHIPFLILRLPLLVGRKPPGNLGKMLHAIRRGTYARIGSGSARKSMVLATDVANLISKWLGSEKQTSGTFTLTDGRHPSFAEMETAIRKHWGLPSGWTLPIVLVRVFGWLGDILPGFPIKTSTIRKITETSTYSDALAREQLDWHPRSVLDSVREWAS